MARQILALYSPMSQSGKSTTLKLLSETLREDDPEMRIATLKISGGIKRITGVALSLVLPAEEDPQDYVDGPKKEEAIPLLGEIGHGRLGSSLPRLAENRSGKPLLKEFFPYLTDLLEIENGRPHINHQGKHCTPRIRCPKPLNPSI